MCQISLGREARIPILGLAGWMRCRGRRQLVIADQPVPGARRSKDLAEALSEQSQGSGRDMSVLVGGGQVMDRFDLGWRELLG